MPSPSSSSPSSSNSPSPSSNSPSPSSNSSSSSSNSPSPSSNSPSPSSNSPSPSSNSSSPSPSSPSSSAPSAWDFDRVTPRQHTASVKWDGLGPFFKNPDLLPLWVADMDFPSPPCVIKALETRAHHGIFGYTLFPPSYYEAVCDWMRIEHNWQIEKEWIVYTPGVVPALNLIVQTFTQPGDSVIVQPPLYYPFYEAIENNGRNIVRNPLCLCQQEEKKGEGEEGKIEYYEMDFEDLQKKIKQPRVRLLILCNPHNPVGKVWSTPTLRRLGEICRDAGVLVVADEIHHDLIFSPHHHTVFASLDSTFAANSITCTSGSKTFNLAGLQISNIIISNPALRQRFVTACTNLGILGPNAFAGGALEVAYREGKPWLTAVLNYIAANYHFLCDTLQRAFPSVRVLPLEGTYLAWVDFRSLGLSASTLQTRLQTEAGVALDEGYIFGPEGEGFERINLACPRSLLQTALDRIIDKLSIHANPHPA